MSCKPVIGEVWQIRLRDAQGHEQQGERPAIVVATPPMVGLATVVPLTTTLNYTRFPFTYEVKPTKQNGLDSSSLALIYQLRCLNASNNRFLRRRGVIEEVTMNCIKRLLRELFDLEYVLEKRIK